MFDLIKMYTKIDWVHLTTFCLIALLIQYLLIITEWSTYSDMITDIQGYKYNFYKNVNNNFSLKNSILFNVGYIFFVLFCYFWVVIDKRPLINVFLFASMLGSFWDTAIYFLFPKGELYIPILSYDTLVVCGVGITLATYLFYNYYSTLRINLPLLLIGYITTMGWFLYDNYLYTQPTA